MDGWFAGEYSTLRSLTPAQVQAAKEVIGETDDNEDDTMPAAPQIAKL